VDSTSKDALTTSTKHFKKQSAKTARKTEQMNTYRVVIETLIDAASLEDLQMRIDNETPGEILESATDIYITITDEAKL
jgi:hypothetical protein